MQKISKRNLKFTCNEKIEHNEPLDYCTEYKIVKPIQPINQAQADYINAINDNIITFSVGPAGTGKSYIAAGLAADMIKEKKIDKIVTFYGDRPIEEITTSNDLACVIVYRIGWSDCFEFHFWKKSGARDGTTMRISFKMECFSHNTPKVMHPATPRWELKKQKEHEYMRYQRSLPFNLRDDYLNHAKAQGIDCEELIAKRKKLDRKHHSFWARFWKAFTS